MAKSYVTQYTEYVSEQQDSLREKLKAKGLSPSPNATLGSLVSDLDSLQESFGTEKYERDPNFPDIDTMFDNDPLRFINGGQYKACSYFIMQVDANNKVGFGFSAIRTGTSIGPYYYGEKVIVSDGSEYDNLTSDWTHTVDPSGIFYSEDGLPYCLLKIYRTDFYVITYTGSIKWQGLVEWIEDTSVGVVASFSTTAISGYTANNYSLQYFRYVGSNVTEENISTYWYSPTGNSTYYGGYTLKYFRVDGKHKFTSNIAAPLAKLVFNGELIGVTSITFGTSGFSSYPSKPIYYEYLKLPYSTNSLTSTLYVSVKSLYIPDNYTSVQPYYNTGNSGFDAPMYLEEVHLGNGLTAWFSQGSRLYNLKHITTSENIFGTNESAITINLSNSSLLTKQSVLNLFNGVADRTGMTANIIRLPARIKSFLTEEEKAILTNKNWTLS